MPPENNEYELRKRIEELDKAKCRLHREEEMLARLTKEHELEEKQLIISEGYSKDMKKSLDKLKNIYLGGI